MTQCQCFTKINSLVSKCVFTTTHVVWRVTFFPSSKIKHIVRWWTIWLVMLMGVVHLKSGSCYKEEICLQRALNIDCVVWLSLFFMQGDFSAKLQQMSFLSQSTVSNPGPQPRTKGRVLIRKAHQKSKTHCLMVSHLISHAYGCRSPKKRLMLERRNMPTNSFEYRLWVSNTSCYRW